MYQPEPVWKFPGWGSKARAAFLLCERLQALFQALSGGEPGAPEGAVIKKATMQRLKLRRQRLSCWKWIVLVGHVLAPFPLRRGGVIFRRTEPLAQQGQRTA